MSVFKQVFPGILTRIKASTFVGNVLVVMTGTALAQMIGFALSPVISRLFTPLDFGVFGSFGAVSSVIAAGVTLEYTQAIMLPKAKEDAINLFVVSCLCTLAIGALCLLCCILAPAPLQGLMKVSGTWVLALLVLSTVVIGLNKACQAWCVRVKAFKHTSASQVVRSVSSSGTQIGLGCIQAGAPGLIAGSVLADIMASLNLVRVLFPDLKALGASIRWERMRKLAMEYRDFPIYAASQNVINTLSLGLPVLLLTHFYGLAVAGAYAFGWRILGASMSFVLTALRQVLFQKACETHHQGGSLVALYVRITSGLFVLAVLPTVVLVVWAPPIFSWIFGAQWLVAGEFSRSLALWMLFAFCNLPAVLFARLIRIQRAIFFYDLAMLAARVTALVCGGAFLNASATIFLYSFVSAAMNMLLILLVGHAVVKREGHISFESIRDCLVKG